MQAEPEVLFEERGRAGFITLNRPRALNALTPTMVREMYAQLTVWAENTTIERVIIRGAGERAFSAGGDIRQVRELGLQSYDEALEFFRAEYRLNALIKRYPKPYVALIDGMVMGGGVGVSVHGSQRISGENTAFAMPEVGIGFFPDVGATFFLPRLPGRLGTYLALTGARLGQADVLWCGIATHAVSRDRFDDLADTLADATDFTAAIKVPASVPGAAPITQVMPAIDRCFAAGSVEGVFEALGKESGEHAEWAASAVGALRTKSPLSLKIALQQMQEGRNASFEECMRIEFRVVSRILRGSDFYEGVRALILDKNNRPNWTHSGVEAVGDAEVDHYFAPLEADELDLQ